MKRRRSDTRPGTAPGLVETLAKSGTVGTWEWDPDTGHFILDEGAAELMAGDARLAGQALRGERAMAGLDRPDATRLLGAMRRAAEQDEGEEEVRIHLRVPARSGLPRRLLCRGRIQRDAQQQPVRGEGTLIDTSDIGAEARALLGLESDGAADAIDEAAELLIAARRAIDASGSRRLRQLVDVLLLEVAREIAGRTGQTQRLHH